MEGLVSHIVEDPTRVACPVIDIISDETFAYIRSFEWHLGAFNWDLHFRWYTIGGVKHHRSLLKNASQSTTPFKYVHGTKLRKCDVHVWCNASIQFIILSIDVSHL